MKTDLSLKERIGIGAVSGFFGGIIFGLLLGPLGMLPEIAQLINSGLSSVGFVVHMVISTLFGALFGFSTAGRFKSFNTGVGLGALYGVFWWLVGGLALMPLLLGFNVQFASALEPRFILSLLGHLAYGVATGFSLTAFTRYNLQSNSFNRAAATSNT